MTTPAPRAAHRTASQDRHGWAVNISTAERWARVVAGAAAIVGGALLLTRSGSVAAIILVLLLIAAGVDLVVTGATGHCPLYQRLGHVPRSLRRTVG